MPSPPTHPLLPTTAVSERKRKHQEPTLPTGAEAESQGRSQCTRMGSIERIKFMELHAWVDGSIEPMRSRSPRLPLPTAMTAMTARAAGRLPRSHVFDKPDEPGAPSAPSSPSSPSAPSSSSTPHAPHATQAHHSPDSPRTRTGISGISVSTGLGNGGISGISVSTGLGDIEQLPPAPALTSLDVVDALVARQGVVTAPAMRRRLPFRPGIGADVGVGVGVGVGFDVGVGRIHRPLPAVIGDVEMLCSRQSDVLRWLTPQVM